MHIHRKVKLAPTLLALSLLTACVDTPKQSPPNAITWYRINLDLEDKARDHAQATMALVDSSGLLCYRAPLPWGGNRRGIDNYLYAHNLADLPAWHGMLMQAVSYQWAADPQRSQEPILSRLLYGLEALTVTTGQPGLIARSAIPDYAGPRQDWMDTKEANPTKYWRRGPNQSWYRNGHAKNHWNMTVCGLAVPLVLHRERRITLSPNLRDRLAGLLVSMTKRIIQNGYRLTNADGDYTEFGDLRPDVAISANWPEVKGIPNGFNRLIVLNALAAASPYDPEVKAYYGKVAPRWLPGVARSMQVLAPVVAAVGHQDFDKPSFSDMQAFATAATSYALSEEDPRRRAAVKEALGALNVFMKHENNPAFTLARVALEDADAEAIKRVVRILRYFPTSEGKMAFHFTKSETSRYQPIENRPPNTNYWKSSPFRRALTVDVTKVASNPKTQDALRFAGADYLYGYWLGRFLGVVPVR